VYITIVHKPSFQTRPIFFFMRFLLLLAFFGIPLFCQAHAVPDIPVRTFFTQDGQCTVVVEVDQR
jgi:hypothetical protein